MAAEAVDVVKLENMADQEALRAAGASRRQTPWHR